MMSKIGLVTGRAILLLLALSGCGSSDASKQSQGDASGGAGLGSGGSSGGSQGGQSGSGGSTSGSGGAAASSGAGQGGNGGGSGSGSGVLGIKLAAGHFQTCVIHPEGRLSCWGTRSQVLVCDPDCIVEPPHEIQSLTDVVEVALGIVHGCALRNEGSVWCWGGNPIGQVGPFGAGDDLPPQLVDVGGPARHVGAGVEFSCAVRLDGSTVCWGVTPTLQARGGGETDPAAVEHLGPVTFLSGAGEHACALLESGEVECWGLSRWGKLGLGEPVDDDPFSPNRVGGLSGVTRLDSAPNRNCVVLGVGDPVCWGRDIERPPTDGQNVDQPVPTALSFGFPLSRVSLGFRHACGVREDGHVVCWGLNDRGQLGVGDADEHAGALEVVSLSDVVEIASGNDHTCALTGDESVWCWGDNSHEQLGTPLPSFSATPIRVGL
jgi:alpha-tubulin suppressor-like RCC1 family protein